LIVPLDPLIAKLLEAAAIERQPEPQTPEEARRLVKLRIAAIPPTTAQIASTCQLSLDLNGRTIPARLYRPLGLETPPFVMFFHGGGWSVCDLDTHENTCRKLCADSRAAVVSVDYRLAPEHPYPAAFDDCYDATLWSLAHAAELSIDADRFVLCGDSAGGNLAAAVAMALRDRGARQANGQALLYPGLRDPALGGASYDAFGTGYGLTRADALKSWRAYYPQQTQPIPAYAAPLHAARFDRLPPTLVVTAEYDVLRDEGEMFAQRIRGAGGDARALRYPGVTHGFLALEPILGIAQAAGADTGAWIAAKLASA
jgi:acetyl esterase